MTRRRLAVISVAALVTVLLVIGIVWLVRNYKPEPVARPCLLSAAGQIKQELRDYAATITEAEAIADEVDVICVLEGHGEHLTMRYYEDDDNFADFVAFALATSHARHLAGYHEFTGKPDVGQQYAVSYLMGVRSDGTVYPPYKLTGGTKWVEDNNPVSHPGALVQHVSYGNASAISVKAAFNQAPPSRYQKGVNNLTIGSGRTTFDKVLGAALTPTGKDDDHGTRSPHKPSVTTTPTGGSSTGHSTARPGKPATTTTAPSTRRTTRTN